MSFKIIFLYFILFFSSFLLVSTQEICVDCTFNLDKLYEQFPDNFFIQSIDIQADFKIDQDELWYLVDIQPMSYVSLKDLEKSMSYLKKKDCFSKIEICYLEKDQKIIIKLERSFTISSLSVHGSMVGKEKYRNCYLMEEGESFDQKKHLHSLQKIKEQFNHFGFFKCSIEDSLTYDSLLKTVKIDLYVSPGPQFSIGNCRFDIQSSEKYNEQDLDSIKIKLQRMFIKRFYTHKYTKNVIDKSVVHFKNYLHKNGYTQSIVTYDEIVDIHNKQVDIIFSFSFQDKKEFIFWGNHFFSREHFLENFLLYGESSAHLPTTILSAEIENMYKAKGFFDIVVEVKEEQEKTFFIIHEGQRALISHVECKDVQNVLEKDCKECFVSLENKYFDNELLQQKLHILKSLYMQHGFWNIKILKEEHVLLKSVHLKNPVYKILLTLDEGSIYYLRSVEIENYPELILQGPFLQFSCLTESVPFNYHWISIQKNWLINYFKDLGHKKVIVTYEYHNSKLLWKINLDEEQVYFGKFIVSGNSKIPFKYLKRELCIEQGQLWDKQKIEKSINNLRNLDLFDTVYIYSYKEIDEQGQVPLGVKLIAADTYEIRTRIGGQQVGKDFSLQQGFSYKVGGTFIYNNPFKFGDKFVGEADFTRFYGNLSIQYLMPWLFNRPIRSRIKIYDNSYRQPLFIGSDVSIYSAYQKGVLFGMQEKHDHATVGMTLGAEFKGVQPANIQDIAVSLDYNPQLMHQQFAFLFAEPSLMLSYVDNVLNPKSGWNAFVSFFAMGDFDKQISLFKLIGEYAVYVPFIFKTSVALRGRVGHIFNRLYQDIMPIDRFYLGGANTLRGYNRDYCPPLGLLTEPVYAPNVGLPLAADNLWRYVNQGGRTMFNLNLEFRFPIYFDFQGAAFFDSGVLIKDSVQDFSENLLGGFGFGFRYNTPIGPLRFDLAFKLQRKYPEFEAPYVWYLTLGQAF